MMLVIVLRGGKMTDRYYTVKRSVRIINKVKDSKFYASVSRASSREEAEEFVNRIKEEFTDATHNVSAYKIGWGDGAVKMADDDGEPAGSSGLPVLQAIEGFGVTNTVVVVTRYFGGTKLGIGGLIRAYGQSASMGLKEAGKVEKRKLLTVSIEIDYQGLGAVINLIEGTQGEIIDIKYGNAGAAVYVRISPGFLQQLEKMVRDSTRGRGRVSVVEEKYFG